MRGVHHFGMELHAVEAALRVLERRHGRVIRRRDDRRARRWGDHGVAMRHPHGLILGQRREQLSTGCVQLGAAELRHVGAVDTAAELEREQLRAVADAEGRDAELEERRIEPRRAVGVDGRGSAGEDQRARVAALELVDGEAVRDQLGVDARLTDPARDQLRVLAAEVDHQNRTFLELRLRSDLDELSRVGNWARPS